MRAIDESKQLPPSPRVKYIFEKADKRYHNLFENVPISIWEEDFSAVKVYLDSLRERILDFRKFFEENTREVVRCTGMVKIIDINQATLTLYQASNKEQLLGGVGQVFGEESYKVF